MTRPAAVTFGMIVLNGQPFLRANLRALYPHAEQIIVCEGAVPGAAALARADGHSRDGTLEALHRFAAEEDPAGKVTIVTAEDEGHPDGFWPGEKHEQSRAYAKRARGELLWQVDVDEFYQPEHIEMMRRLFAARPELTGAAFHMLTFWGSPDVVTDGWFLRRGAAEYRRLFRWGEGYEYVTHRPPTVADAQGRDAYQGHWLSVRRTRGMGITLYHYSLLLPRSVREKSRYYLTAEPFGDRFAAAQPWMADSYLTLRRPFRVHNVYLEPSWLERFDGVHPPAAAELWRALEASRDGTGDGNGGRVGGVGSVGGALESGVIELRDMRDVERLLRSPAYRAGRAALQVWEPVDRQARAAGLRLRRAVSPVARPIRRRLAAYGFAGPPRAGGR